MITCGSLQILFAFFFFVSWFFYFLMIVQMFIQ